MIKLKQTALFFIAVFTLVSFNSCDNNDKSDTAKPVVTLETPINGQEFAPGDIVTIKGLVEAEAGIQEIKIDIHFGEGHSHGTTRDAASEQTKNWEDHKVITDASGSKLYKLEEQFTVPKDATHGHYHLGILVTDKEKREIKKYIEIEIEGDHEE